MRQARSRGQPGARGAQGKRRQELAGRALSGLAPRAARPGGRRRAGRRALARPQAVACSGPQSKEEAAQEAEGELARPCWAVTRSGARACVCAVGATVREEKSIASQFLPPPSHLLLLPTIHLPIFIMSAIFDFSSLITVLLLLICTCTYLRELRPAIFDPAKVRESPHVISRLCHSSFIILLYHSLLFLITFNRPQKSNSNKGNLMKDDMALPAFVGNSVG